MGLFLDKNYENYEDILNRKVVRTKVDSKELLKEIVLSKAQDKLTDEAIKMLYQIGNGVMNKKHYYNDSNREDCKQAAFLHLFTPKVWKSFDETRFHNPFAYYTEVYKRAMALEFNRLTFRDSGTRKYVKLIYSDNMDI